MRALALATALLAAGCGSAAGGAGGDDDANGNGNGDARPSPERFDHAALDALLRRRVKDGLVDYVGLAREDRAALRGYLDALATADPKAFADDDERKAFWINAYNAFVIEAVLAHWPVEDVTRVDGFFDEERHRVAGADRTLNEIEKSILKSYEDERTHFVLVCAALGCPKLASRAYRGEDLDARLDAAARAFVRDPRKVRLEGDTIHASKIFGWYREEFVARTGSRREYLAIYAEEATAKRLRAKEDWDWQLTYDWTINAQRR